MKKSKLYKGYALFSIPVLLVGLFLIQLFLGLNLLISALLAVNVLTFLLFGFDKMQSIRRAYRVPENVLFTLVLLGGSAGALIGMNVFRHKTSKMSFQFVIAVILLLQIGLIYLFWEDLGTTLTNL